MKTLNLNVWPRKTADWDEFLATTPECSIALDGVVRGGPRWDEKTRHVNFDHHDNVVREATMSTCMQAFYAVKGGIFETFRKDDEPFAEGYVNDSDQDTTLAVFQLDNPRLIEGTNSIPALNRLIELTNRLDITGGAFPLNLDERLLRQHNWIFEPYTKLRQTGALATATADVIKDNIETMCSRIMEFLMNRSGERKLDTRHEILYESPLGFKVVHEIGGNEARYHLFSKGMNAFISLVATRPDGKKVYSVGKRSRYIPFPVPELYDVYNAAEGLTRENGWNGSDIVGGSSRHNGSNLDPLELAKLTEECLKKERKA